MDCGGQESASEALDMLQISCCPRSHGSGATESAAFVDTSGKPQGKNTRQKKNEKSLHICASALVR